MQIYSMWVAKMKKKYLQIFRIMNSLGTSGIKYKMYKIEQLLIRKIFCETKMFSTTSNLAKL